MAIENYDDCTLLVTLPKEPDLGSDMATVNNIVTTRGGCNVLVDFSRVDVVASASISTLLILRGMMEATGHKLVLFNVAMPTRCIFRVSGLSGVFDFAEDKAEALEILHAVGI